MQNRSMPANTVIPVLAYPDVEAASRWLCEAFGFELRLTIGNHRVHLGFGDGAVVVTTLKSGGSAPSPGDEEFSVMVRVEDVDAHHRRAMRRGAMALTAPTSYPYGERQYSCRDLAGHAWTFSQTIADVAPEEWGGRTERHVSTDSDDTL
ncbi:MULTISPECIES: VOC family protein [unclassified Mesorhizobium]|uniref:VOC family protein n=1 Tax=unclassified Mesorhizobium TaxID=325217 RepID=UPI000BAFB52B|nr:MULTISPECIES: VOC family protein [unclassified Mesorhizobium]PBC20794.1 glyoxalase [Mesorhizobium sp. WSM4311]TRD03344.1 glyoxalase [Mesorhizobium sp. WSM4305]